MSDEQRGEPDAGLEDEAPPEIPDISEPPRAPAAPSARASRPDEPAPWSRPAPPPKPRRRRTGEMITPIVASVQADPGPDSDAPTPPRGVAPLSEPPRPPSVPPRPAVPATAPSGPRPVPSVPRPASIPPRPPTDSAPDGSASARAVSAPDLGPARPGSVPDGAPVARPGSMPDGAARPRARSAPDAREVQRPASTPPTSGERPPGSKAAIDEERRRARSRRVLTIPSDEVPTARAEPHAGTQVAIHAMRIITVGEPPRDEEPPELAPISVVPTSYPTPSRPPPAAPAYADVAPPPSPAEPAIAEARGPVVAEPEEELADEDVAPDSAPPVYETPSKPKPPPRRATVKRGEAIARPNEATATAGEPVAAQRPEAPREPEKAPPKPRARPWWEEVFNEDFNRASKRLNDEQVRREADFILESLGVAAGGVLLDLACGCGQHAVEIASRGFGVVGYDLSLVQLALAADIAQERGQKINFLQGDMREMAFEEMFDGVYSWNTSFGYFEEEKNLLVAQRVFKALRPGGMFLLDVANRDFAAQHQPSAEWYEGDSCVCMDDVSMDFITSRLRVKRTVMLDDGRTRECHYSIRLYSLHELGKMLHDVGFRVTEASGHPAMPGVFFGAHSPRIIVLAERP